MNDDFAFDSSKKLYASKNEYFCVGCMDLSSKKVHLIAESSDPALLICPVCKQTYKNPDYKAKTPRTKKSIFDL